jgi:hypothetical protein
LPLISIADRGIGQDSSARKKLFSSMPALTGENDNWESGRIGCTNWTKRFCLFWRRQDSFDNLRLMRPRRRGFSTAGAPETPSIDHAYRSRWPGLYPDDKRLNRTDRASHRHYIVLFGYDGKNHLACQHKHYLPEHCQYVSAQYQPFAFSINRITFNKTSDCPSPSLLTFPLHYEHFSSL